MTLRSDHAHGDPGYVGYAVNLGTGDYLGKIRGLKILQIVVKLKNGCVGE